MVSNELLLDTTSNKKFLHLHSCILEWKTKFFTSKLNFIYFAETITKKREAKMLNILI